MTPRRRLRAFAALVGILVAALLVRTTFITLYPYPYRDEIRAAAARYGFDPLLLAAVIRTESGFRPDAVSRRGALGLMQLLPETAREISAAPFDADGLYDPAVNVDLGARYLALLRTRFDGRLSAALAAYNGGGANVRSWIQSGKWDGTYAHAADIPFAETRQFVERVYRAYRMYQWLYGRE